MSGTARKGASKRRRAKSPKRAAPKPRKKKSAAPSAKAKREAKRKETVLIAMENFFDAQDNLEDDNCTEAVRSLEECLKLLSSISMEGGAFADEEDIPDPVVLASVASNTLGEVFMDETMKSSGQERLGGNAMQQATALFERALTFWPENPTAAMNAASLCRDKGDIEQALEYYKRAYSMPSAVKDLKHLSEDHWIRTWVMNGWEQCRHLAAYHMMLLLSQLGRHDDVIPIFSRFGGGYRLCPAVWDESQNPTAVPTKSGRKKSPVRLLTNAFPPELGSELRRAFSPSSPYWGETGYSTRGYFSFYYDPANKPSNTVEQLIAHLIKLSGRGDIVATEWWVHTRMPGRDLGHQLHYDMEEKTLESEGRILHPAISAVVYLTGSAAGGSTLLLNQTVDAKEMAQEGWMVSPVDQGVLMFDGSLLHGVLPSSTPAQGESNDRPQRLTLMVALWDTKDFAKSRPGYGPQARIPKCLKSCSWPSLLTCLPPEKLVHTPPEEGRVVHLSPVWEEVPRHKKSDLVLQGSIDQRFFVPGPGYFKEVLLKEHVAKS